MEKPASPIFHFTAEKLGVRPEEVVHIGDSFAADVEGAGDNGVVVTAIDPDGPAAGHGFRTGDVILNVGGNSVSSVADVRTALDAAKDSGKHSVLMRVKTADATRFVAMPLAKG